MGRPKSEAGSGGGGKSNGFHVANRSTPVVLRNVPSQLARGKTEPVYTANQHCSLIVRKRIEYSNGYANCLNSRHLLHERQREPNKQNNNNNNNQQQQHQQIKPRNLKPSSRSILNELLYWPTSTHSMRTSVGMAKWNRISASKAPHSKPTSAFHNKETLLTCTCLLLATCAIGSLFALESASAAAISNHQHEAQLSHHKHQPDWRHQSHQRHNNIEHNKLTHQQAATRSQVDDDDDDDDDDVIGRSRLANSDSKQFRRAFPGHHQASRVRDRKQVAAGSESSWQHLLRFRGFATHPHERIPMRASFSNSSHFQRPLAHNDEQLDSSYNVDDVFADEDSEIDDAQEDGQSDEFEPKRDGEHERDDDDDEQDVDLDSEEANRIDSGLDREEQEEGAWRWEKRPRDNNNNNNNNKLNPHQKLRKHERRIEQSLRSSAGRSSQQPLVTQHHRRRHHEFGQKQKQLQKQQQQQQQSRAKPRVPYQTPIVVSISDNSFVSASPAGAGSTSAVLSGGERGGESVREQRAEVVKATADRLATSTTATTTREAFTESSHRLDRQLPEVELGDEIRSFELDSTDRVQGEPSEMRRSKLLPTSGSHNGIVLDNSKRYNYIVSDPLERPASERRHSEVTRKRHRDGQQEVRKGKHNNNNKWKHSARSGTPQASELANVALAPTLATPIHQHVHENLDARLPVSELDSLLSEVDDDDDDPDDDDQDDQEDDAVAEDEGDEDDRDDADDDEDDERDEAAQEVELDARFARASEQLDNMVLHSASLAKRPGSSSSVHYSNLIVNPRNELPPYGRRHLASIRMIQEDPNVYQQGGALNGAIIAILFGVGVTGMLVLIVGVKMRTIRERIAHKGRRRSLVPDTDFLINTIPI